MQRLSHVLAEVFDGQLQSAIEAESFRHVEGFDSLAYMELVAAVEREFQLELSAEEAHRLQSYEGLRSVLEARGLDT